jgi:hypothetical protein
MDLQKGIAGLGKESSGPKKKVVQLGKSKGQAAVGKKISKLVGEGKPQDQTVATALSMKRAGRLTENGGYVRAKKG